MECQECGKPLMISNSKYTSPIDSTDVFSELTLVCTNPKCKTFSGKDLNKPLKIAKTEKRKVN